MEKTEIKKTSNINLGEVLVFEEGKRELIERIINGDSYSIFCTISKDNNNIIEKTYDLSNEKLSCVNKIDKNHPRYLGLLSKLNQEGL